MGAALRRLTNPKKPKSSKPSYCNSWLTWIVIYIICIHYIHFFGHTCSMQKFPDQGLNLSHSSENTRSLTASPSGNSLYAFKKKWNQCFSFCFFWGAPILSICIYICLYMFCLLSTDTQCRIFFLSFFLSFFFFLCSHLWHMEFLRLGQIRGASAASATSKALLDLSCICDLCCSLQQRQILNPLMGTRDRTCILPLGTILGS